jgi:hypothetical protein
LGIRANSAALVGVKMIWNVFTEGEGYGLKIKSQALVDEEGPAEDTLFGFHTAGNQ